ncbi:restriction endonuclease subunit S [Aliarcobacter butzleri]|uniref:restriction endonuclease subunit S n=1 Tax=Aliarcobacter butzleri TaxID=28197 RepID=UPI001C0A7563|nr:restriction endonuclease subunit S [Aliarcobacter butzleri]
MTAKSKVPQIRFKGFSGEWETKQLGEIGSVAMNKRIFKNQTTEKGDIPFYKIGTFGGTADAFISRQLFEDYKSKYPYPQKGDLLISASGSIGRIVEYKGEDEYFQDSNIVWLKHEDKIENSFLKQFYNIVKWNGLEGSTIQRLYNKNILDTEISFPKDRIEQTKIGDYFQQLDKLIEQKEKKYQKLKQFKKAMLDKMFPKNGADTPEIRFKGFSGKWEEKRLEEIALIKTGYPFDSNKFDANGEYLVITNGNIQNDFSFVDNLLGNKINIEDKCSLTEYILNLNDILVTMDGTVGRVAKVIHEKQILAQRVGRIIALIDSDFVYYFLSTGDFFKKMKLISTGGTIKHISLNDISKYESYIPKDFEEQEKIGNYFQKLDKQIDLQQKELEKLKNIKKASLSKMFV